MQRAVRHISAILGRVIFIGFSIQIVFGMTWMCLNFSKLPQFGESFFYVEISKNFICDEYTGILYPVFLLLARGLEGLAGLPYYCVMYVVQLLVACYAIGWSISEEELAAYPHMQFASGERDTGVIVSFNSEAEEIDDSLIIPAGTHTLAINPLNWKTDGTPADKSENLGACFTDYEGNIQTEIPHLTGAYIDSERGALKITDVSAQDYPAGLSIFQDGIYHIYDYQFFYRNLQENVGVRVDAYFAA